jgi:hypothetical protein
VIIRVTALQRLVYQTGQGGQTIAARELPDELLFLHGGGRGYRTAVAVSTGSRRQRRRTPAIVILLNSSHVPGRTSASNARFVHSLYSNGYTGFSIEDVSCSAMLPEDGNAMYKRLPRRIMMKPGMADIRQRQH